ncbi:MAG: uracil-DNA glycosylase [Caulobacteraceae bacterium]|nr:uracil-DNA glycosylase [Caulobacteraceae bacterium]
MTPASPDPRALESLLAFWRDAGVEGSFEDSPVDRTLAQPKPEARPVTRLLATVEAAPDYAAGMADAKALAAGAADLDALKAAIASFQGCSLRNEGAKQAVFARGNPQGEVMIIGEAPGADEDAQGEPFVGRAGKLLDRMLAAAGLTGNVFITNTVFWRPPGNRVPSLQEQAVCAPFVERAITLVKPRILVLAGAAPTKALLKQAEGILALRGKWFEWRSEEGGLSIPVMPTLHPAFLLRQPQAKKKSWSDLLALTRRLAEG